MRFTRLHFLGLFFTIVFILLIIKCTNPNLTLSHSLNAVDSILTPNQKGNTDSILVQSAKVDSIFLRTRASIKLVTNDGQPVKNRVVSVPTFADAFPDMNDVQLATAQRLGLASVIANRSEAIKHSDKLVYIGDNPFYKVERLHQSIPYLVPRAATLLNEIARSFIDSCASKGVGFHKIVITSVTRTQEDVEKLRRFNSNASEQSCHLYGTTFDIGYNKFERVNDPDGTQRPTEWGTRLKSILAEVLNDQRRLGTCYIKYEYRKPCFHITCR